MGEQYVRHVNGDISNESSAQNPKSPIREIFNHASRDEQSNTEVGQKEAMDPDDVFSVAVHLPHAPYEIQVMVAAHEQVQDLRQSIMESPKAFEYSCFHLEFQDQRINDYIELSEVKGFGAGAQIKLVEDPYTEKEARMHLMRFRDLVGTAGEKVDSLHGIAAGLSLHDAVCPWKAPEDASTRKSVPPSTAVTSSTNALAGFDFDASPALQTLVPPSRDSPSKTIKSLIISPWNPPPPYLRQQGHLMYLLLTTNEGEQFQLTSHAVGFFVNRSSNSRFDPFPKPEPKNASAHSLLPLIKKLSPSFEATFDALLKHSNQHDPLATFPLTNAIPSSPWIVSQSAISSSNHSSDVSRTQEACVSAGLDGSESMRDWNEEIQATKELPRESVQERVFRERLISKIYAEFSDAAAKGAVLVARGEIAPLNPTEAVDAQIFVYNNVFYSFGADGVGTFTSEGGDEAARVAVGKDVMGVKSVNQLDVAGLSTAGTMIVDYLGRRIVAQSIVPGIFKPREPDEHQVDYGGVEGRDVIAVNEKFVTTFSHISKALRVKKHPVWDKEGKRYDLEGSVETKGLLGTDGRKYILDLYRLTPLDIPWLEEHCHEHNQKENETQIPAYPHRMTILRPELIDSYWRLKMSEYVKEQLEQRRKAEQQRVRPAEARASEEAGVKGAEPSKTGKLINGHTKGLDEQSDALKTAKPTQGNEVDNTQERVDISAFSLTLNPDVFSGQVPQTEDEKAELEKDEQEVRAVCTYLQHTVFTELLSDLREGEVGFPMDGSSLSNLLHKRGINIRYLGKLATVADKDARGSALKALAEQEMTSRAFKHVALKHLKNLPAIFATACIAHLLNCMLGTSVNSSPKVALDEGLRIIYPNANLSFSEFTPHSLAFEIRQQVQLRYRYTLATEWALNIKHVQLLRSISLKLGLQLVSRDYAFTSTTQTPEVQVKPVANGEESQSTANGITNDHTTSNGAGRKKRKAAHQGPAQVRPISPKPGKPHTFYADDIANVVPVIKDSCPKSSLAEEAFEAGKISLMQNQREIGQELLLESLTLHEQIYGALHPEVARVYHQLAMLYFQMDEKPLAIDLAHKAVIISERTLGIDSSETILSYLNLALFEHGNQNTTIAVACVRHALELWNIIYGSGHPDSMTTLNNAAVMLQQMALYHDSRIWFERSLSMSEQISGRSSINTGTLLFQLAQSLVLDGDHKGSVQRMREAYSIFLNRLGPTDVNTRESEQWLEKLTQNAVSIAKQAKDVQARRIRRLLTSSRNSGLGAAQPQAGQMPTRPRAGGESASISASDNRSIDELIRIIESGGDISKVATSKKRSPRGHPRRRGGSSIGAIA